MKKRFLCLIFVCALVLTGNSAFALSVKEDYCAPHEEMSYGGKLKESEPSEFAIENLAYKTLLASEDFTQVNESTDLLKMGSSTIGEGYNISYDNEAVKMVGKPDALEGAAFYPTFNMRYTGEIIPGEYYAFRCKIKTENVTGTPGNRIAAWGTKWLNDAAGNYGRNKETVGTHEYTMTQLIKAKEGTTSFWLVGYYNDGSEADTGTVWFDDFELYHVAVDPMEAVLIKPNYKGIVYGDGDADINMKISVKESAFFSYDDLSLAVTLEDAQGYVYKRTELDTVSEFTNVVFSSRGLSEGDYYLNTALRNKTDDKVISEKELIIRKRDKNYRPKNYVDDEGYFVRNGERTLLTRIYSGDNIDVTASAAKTAGIDNIAAYGYWWADKDAAKDFSTKAQKVRDLGIHTSIMLKDMWYGNQRGLAAETMVTSMSDMLPVLYKITNDYKNDAILDGYNIFDETNPVISGEELSWGNKILAEADVDNPTYGVANQNKDYYGIYTDLVDILTVDPYPIRGTDEDATNISKVSQDVKNIRENFPNRPIGAALQGFFYSPTNDAANRSPNRTELLNMMWQALCEGATVIEWYSYDSMMSSDEQAAAAGAEVKTDEEWIADLNAVFAELNNYEDIILSSEPTPNYNVTGGGDWLNIMLKRYGGKTYIFAVNNTKDTKCATVTVDGAGSYDLSFDALEVKKVEISQSDFLSPEAELICLGFYNGTDVFAVAEGEENILYVKQNSGVINYCADISDGASLYFGKERVPLRGKITVSLADEFTVTVVAEDDKTKTTKKYNVVKV